MPRGARTTTSSRRQVAVVAAATSALLATLLPLAPTAAAASLGLDQTYGSSGILSLTRANGGFGAFNTVVSNGVTYVAGDLNTSDFSSFVRVYARNAAGQPLAAFSGDGIVDRANPLGEDEYVGGSAAAPGGGLFVLLNRFAEEPYAPLDDRVLKLLPSGAVDTTYGGGDGVADVPAGSAQSVNAFASDSAGRLYIAGDRRNSSDTLSIPTLTRLDATGAADSAFGGDGVIDSPLAAREAYISELVVDPEGRPYYLQVSFGPESHELVRLTDAGALDPTFSDDGHLTVSGSNAGGLLVSGVAPSAGTVVVGLGAATMDAPARLLRLTSAGIPDTTFGSGGYASLPLGAECFPDFVMGSAEDHLGRLVVLRATCPRSAADPVRVSPAGAVDTAFGLVNGLDDARYVSVSDVDILPGSGGGILLSGGDPFFSASGPSYDVAKALHDVDRTAPTVSTTTPAVFSLATTTGLGFSGTDGGSGLLNFDVRYRRAAWNAGFGALTYPSTWQRTTARSVSVAAPAGATTCFSVRSRDKAGNTSAWSPERCSARPLDDRSLTASAGWARSTGSAYYGGTVTSTTRSAVTLTRTGVQARRLSLVASRCSGCGLVGVYWNGTLIRKINLSSTTTAHRQLFTVVDFGTVKSGTVTVKTLNSGRTNIDGLAVRRT